MKRIEKYLVLKPFIEKVTNGGMFKFMFAWFFRILAVLELLGVLWASWKLWGRLNSKMPIKYFIGGIILQIFIVIIAYVIVNILLIRSNDIQNLPSTKEYSVTPIIVIVFKTMGEIMAASYIVLGFALGVATFIVGDNVARFMPISMPGLSSSGSGFSIMIFGVIFAFLTLFFFYWIAEIWSAIVDTARNTSIMANTVRKKQS